MKHKRRYLITRDSIEANFDEFLQSNYWVDLQNEVYSKLSHYWDIEQKSVNLTIWTFKKFICKCVKPPATADCVDPIVDKLQCTCEALEHYIHHKFSSSQQEVSDHNGIINIANKITLFLPIQTFLGIQHSS